MNRRSLRSLFAVLTLAPAPLLATGDFYEQPLQTLADYLRLDQLPAKSFEQILAETSKPEAEAAKINFQKELVDLTKKPGPEALATVDKMIAAARTESANALLNLLNDLRDLFSGPATAAETESYLEWRIGQADRFGVSFEKAKEGARAEERDGPNPELIADIERHLTKATPALKPHWLYLRGAVEYRAGRIGESQAWFSKVTKDFPKSPRAESALFMAARCQLWRSRSPDYTQQDMKLIASQRPATKKLFDEYFAKYPHGRLLGDALGWYGAFAYDGHDFPAALRCYTQQLELTDHPELQSSAAEMVEKTLSHLASEPRDKAFAEVAKRPRAAQALVYLIINTSESDNFNGKLDSTDEVRGWRKSVLPKVAAALAAEAKLYQDAEWKPRHLAMLAYAASGAGQHEQALKLLETAGAAAQESDDLLFARAVVLHRAKRPGEAVTALQTLIEKFPKSPLAKGARLRLGLALTDNHQAGEAVLALGKLLEKPAEPEKKADAPDAEKKEEPAAEDEGDEDAAKSRILYGLDVNQVRALIDTLLNFAPIEELAATSQPPGLDPVLRLQLTEPIAQRLLAREQFDEAKKFMTPAQWGLVAGPLEKLTLAAKAAKEPAARAAACLQLADAWAAARGKLLTYPLDTNETRHNVFIDFSSEADVRRADSAPFVGATGNFKLDLENRDELRHAFNWWIEASDAQPGAQLTAQALWRALKALPQIADVSPVTFERAVARKWTETARKLSDRLRKECADSVEAKRYAVAWDFTVPKKKNPQDETYSEHRDAAGAGIPAMDAFGLERDYSGAGATATAMIEQLSSFERDAGAVDAVRLKARAETLRDRVRREFASLYDARWVNYIDDLALFFSEPDPGPDVRQRYVHLRARFLNESAIGGTGFPEDLAGKPDPDAALRKEINEALADAKTKPVADYFEFLNLAVIANHFVFVEIETKEKKKKESDAKDDDDTYRTRDYPQLAKAAAAFLEKYPQSKKREAALLLHARATYRNSEEIALRKFVTWPQAPRWEGGFVALLTQRESFDAKRVLATLDAYDRAFPRGRYAADIRNYRAAVALRLHDWKTALELTIAQLDDKNCAGLDGDAARRLGELFTQLTDERCRADLLPVIRASKRGRELLEKYVAFESDTHPLRYMKAWLHEQLVAK